eukprot:gene6778-biopygen4614
MDMDSLFHRQWPSLQLEYKPCAQQKRGSNDCGIHMTAHFFADHTRTEIRNATTIGKRLRPFLASASHAPMDKGQFMREMVYILKDRGNTFSLGSHGIPPMVGGAGDPGRKRGRPRKTEPTTPQDTTTPTTMTRASPDIQTVTGSPLISEKVRVTMAQAQKTASAAASRQLCYFLVATALVNVGDGGNRCLDLDAIANQATRKGFKPSTQYDIGETLAAYDKELDFLVEGQGGAMTLIPRRRGLIETWYVQPTGSEGLPQRLETHTFRIGGRYEGQALSTHTLGVTAGTSGHYVLTTDPQAAHFSVYINARMDRYPNTARSTRQRRNSVKIDKAPETPRALRRVPRKSTKAEVDETDLVQVLADPVPQGLNSVGLRQQGKAASPNSWYVYQDKPYFLQPTAWRAKTSDTRKLHIRWINEIKSMPAEYLDRDLTQAIMEYVRHIAVMRQ